MRRGSTWELLGIAPTADQGAIRNAYARKRDDLDADRDPSLAIALREAFESAKFAAQWLKPEDVPDLSWDTVPTAEFPIAHASAADAIIAPIKPPEPFTPPPTPVVEIEPLPAPEAEPPRERVPEEPEPPPQQVAIRHAPRKGSPWRPRQPSARATGTIATEKSPFGTAVPSLAKRMPKGLRLLPMLMAGAVVYAIFHAFGSFTPSPSVPEPEKSISRDSIDTAPELPTGELTKPVADIDRALQEKFGEALDIGRIQARNPALLAQLEALWERNARADVTSQQFVGEVGALADRWYLNGVTGSNVALTTDRSRLAIDMAIALRAEDMAKCTSFLEGDRRWDPALGLDEALHTREIALMARTLLETDGESHEAVPATIPASVIQTAAHRARTSPDEVRTWLTRKNRVPENCNIAIATIESVLELPAALRLPILRVI